MIVFIDWISTPDHAGFNQALFEALRLKNACCYVFDEGLVTESVPCHKAVSDDGRLARFQAVKNICAKHQSDNIFFLSYDPVLLPFLGKHARNCMLFEHNTVPEGGILTKHSLWQRLLFPRVTRLAQFPAQHETLSAMGQKSVFLGSPILTDRFEDQGAFSETASLLLVPSFRAERDEIEKIAQLAKGIELVVKKEAIENASFPESTRKQLTAVDRIEMDANRAEILGIAITVTSRIRGTGWFNDAISRGIPLLMSNANAANLFKETFPEMPFTRISDVQSVDDLKAQLRSRNRAAKYEQVLLHNQAVRTRFFKACTAAGWVCS